MAGSASDSLSASARCLYVSSRMAFFLRGTLILMLLTPFRGSRVTTRSRYCVHIVDVVDAAAGRCCYYYGPFGEMIKERR